MPPGPCPVCQPPPPYRADPARARYRDLSAIYVRGQRDGVWTHVDVCELDRASLIRWCQAPGPDPLRRTLNVLLLLCGHEMLDIPPSAPPIKVMEFGVDDDSPDRFEAAE